MAIRHRKKQSTTRLWLLVALLVAVVAVIFLLPSGESATAQAAEQTEPDIEGTTLVKAGMEAPDFSVELFDGGTLTLSELKGKVVWLNFWATWCPPCRAELKRVQTDIVDHFAGQEFLFLPISRQDTREQVAAFREQNGYTFTMGLDPDRAIYDRFASNYIPRNFLIDQQGRVVMTSVGYEPEEFEAMIKKAEELLKN